MGGKFIAFEGIDGAGKSGFINTVTDHIQRLKPHLTIVQTREPGGTVLGEKLRSIALEEDMTAESETLLMFAARQELLSQVIRPSLALGQWVITDRFIDSSYAYQCAGRGIAKEHMDRLVNWIVQDLRADHVLLFDVPAEVAHQRRRQQNRQHADRFEAQSEAFFDRVRLQFLAQARANPNQYTVIDNTQPIEKTEKILINWVENFCSTSAE